MEFQKEASPIEALENAAPRIAEKRRRRDALLPNDDLPAEDRSRIMAGYEQALEKNSDEGAAQHAIHALAQLTQGTKQGRRNVHPALSLAKTVAAILLDVDQSSDLSWSEPAYQHAMDLAEIEPHLTDGPQLRAIKEAARAKLDRGQSIDDCRLEVAAIRSARRSEASVAAHSGDDEANWCIVLVRPGKEVVARDALCNAGVKTWWPHYRDLMPRKQNKNGRLCRSEVLRPVIAGFLFCNAVFDEKFYGAIDLTPGYIDVVRGPSGHALKLSTTDVVLLQKIEEGLRAQPAPKDIHNFKRGEKVRFVGAAAGWPSGRIADLYKGGRLSVEVGLMGRKVAVTVLPHQIERM